MARFQALIKGQKGEASRLGSAKSGISATARGWDVGVQVYGFVDERGKDRFVVYRTSGSNGHSASVKIAEFGEDDVQ